MIAAFIVLIVTPTRDDVTILPHIYKALIIIIIKNICLKIRKEVLEIMEAWRGFKEGNWK